MLLKKTVLIIFILAVLCYISGFFNLPFVFIISFVAFFYLAVYVLVTNISWLIVPKKIKNNFNKHRVRFCLIILGSLILLYLGRYVISRYYLPGASPLLRRPVKFVLLIFTVFFCWNLLKNIKAKKTKLCIIIYCLFIILALPKAFFNIKSGPAIEVSSIKPLSTLGYTEWAPAEDIEKSSVTTYIQELSFKGMNIYTARSQATALLIDMQGDILHTWTLDMKNDYNWQYVELLKNGELLSYALDKMLIRIGWDSKPKWKKKIRAHHDFCVAENGDIYALARKDSVVFFAGIPVPVLEDYIAVLSSDGEQKATIRIYPAIKKWFSFRKTKDIYQWIIKPKNLQRLLMRKFSGEDLFQYGEIFDIMHTNSIELTNQNIEGVCKKNNALISIRQIDLIGFLDTKTERFGWTWGPGIVSGQHHPTLLDNGNILIFDNGSERGYSHVIELDPISKTIKWEYMADPKEEFFTYGRGSSQRLLNGNTLITESNKGRVFEITRNGKIVWEFYNPNIQKETQSRGIIYRMMRIVNPEDYPQLKNFLDTAKR